jgi:hypothetical protein
MGNANAGGDAQRFRDGYPGQHKQESKQDKRNLKFFDNKLKSVPDGSFSVTTNLI